MPDAATDAARIAEARILWRHDWAPHLFSFRVERPAGLAFVPGQFVRLGLEGADGAMVWRAYSIASPPSSPWLEFYSIVVPDGPFTQPLSRRGPGDAIVLDRTVYGFLRTDRFSDGDDLWLLATGTGIAPFVSILGDDAVHRRFATIVVAHSVQREGELAYRADIETCARTSRGRLRYLPIVTRAPRGPRLGALLDDGQLEGRAGATLDAARSRLMICGNPSMIKDVRDRLRDRGLAPVRRDVPGQFITENFW